MDILSRLSADRDAQPCPEPTELSHHLSRAHARELGLFLGQWTGADRSANDELVHETLLRASRILERQNANPAAIRPWLFILARRIVIEASRTGRTRTGSRRGTEPVAAVVNAVGPFSAASMAAALREVAPDNRQVLIELLHRGRSVPDTARLLGIAESEVRARAYHALRALRSAMTVASETAVARGR